MHVHELPGMTRRDKLKLAAASAILFSLPAMTGCTSFPKDKPAGTGAGKALTLVHCNVIDVLQGDVNHDQTITIVNGMIESIKASLRIWSS